MPNPPQQYPGWAHGNPEITGDITGYAYPPQPPSNEVWGGKGYADLPPDVQRYIATAPSITDAEANAKPAWGEPGAEYRQKWPQNYRGWQQDQWDYARNWGHTPMEQQLMGNKYWADQWNYPRSEQSTVGRLTPPSPLRSQMYYDPAQHQLDTQPPLYRLPNGQYVPMHKNPDGTLSIPAQSQYQGNPNSFYWNPPGYRTPQPSIWEYLDAANQWAFPMGYPGMDTVVRMSGGYGDGGAAQGGADVTTPGSGKKP